MDELWVIRHAESKGNAGQATSRPDSNSLTKNGHAQADLLADTIDTTPDYIEATTYFRTQQTAFPTLKKLGLHEYHVSREFREMTYLDPKRYNGTTQAQRSAAAKAYWDQNDPNHHDGGDSDSFATIAKHVRNGLARIHAKPGNLGFLFSHGMIMSLLNVLSEQPGMNDTDLMRAFRVCRDAYPVKNCAVLKLRFNPDGSIVKMTPDTPFLNLIGN